MLVPHRPRLSVFALSGVITFLTLVLALLSSSLCAYAQFQASLRGTVTDPTGAVIPGVTVTLSNDETNQTLTSQSNGAGIHSFNGLAPGHYHLVAQRDGFQKKAVSQIVLIPEQPNALNLQM